MNRVLLINKTKAPTREELVTSERRMGELLFARFPELQWAGYITTLGYNRMSANWIIPNDSMESFKEFASSLDSDTYEIAVFADGLNHFGGQTEVRVA